MLWWGFCWSLYWGFNHQQEEHQRSIQNIQRYQSRFPLISVKTRFYPACFSIQLENYFIGKDPHLTTSSYKSELSTSCSSCNLTGAYCQPQLLHSVYLWKKNTIIFNYICVFLTRVGLCAHKTVSRHWFALQWSRAQWSRFWACCTERHVLLNFISHRSNWYLLLSKS